MATIAQGDRVRITIEGPHIGPDLEEGPQDNDAFVFSSDAGDIVTVEKIEPPVVTFKPGDRVRDRFCTNIEFTVGRNGYFDHLNGRVVLSSNDFDSRHFELV
jgi:hypothetical protein